MISASDVEQDTSSHARRKGLFQKSGQGDLDLDLDIESVLLLNKNEVSAMEPETEEMIKNCMKGFFFTDDAFSKMEMFLKAMQKEVMNIGDVVISEGESGKKLYIIDSGKFDVNIEGEFIRQLSSG